MIVTPIPLQSSAGGTGFLRGSFTGSGAKAEVRGLCGLADGA